MKATNGLHCAHCELEFNAALHVRTTTASSRFSSILKHETCETTTAAGLLNLPYQNLNIIRGCEFR